MNETNRSKFKKRALTLAVASCLSFAPWVTEAAGLGKLTVLSGLGQPLRAELDLGATREELSGMSARLASQDAFRQAGIDYATVLYDLRLSVETKANGQGVVKLTSGKPVNDPFLDFLIELNWPAGRLVREYTFLLDPPEIAVKQPSRPVAEAKIVETVQGGGALPERPTRAVTRSATPAKASIEPKKSDGADSRVVQPGETLRKIATETKYEGVSLEQMLVGLFQKNPDAFMGNNINRLKSGAILGLPDKAAVEAISEAQAKKVYLTQAGDWNAYRQKLAATAAKAPAKEAAASQLSAGKITAKVQEKAAQVESSKDQVKVSRTEMAAAGASAGKAEAEVDRVARERALKEAQERLAQLEKNVGELQKLVEMKNQKLAEMQQQSAAKKEEAKPVEPVKPIEPAKPVEIAKPVEPPKVEEAPKAPKAPEEVKPVVAEKPVEAVMPVEPKPLPPKKVAPPPPPPEPEPGFVETLLSDPLPLAGGGGILALLLGYLFYKRRRSSNASMETTAASGATSLARDSVFRATGGQSVDTGNTPPQTGDFSQTGPGTIDTDEVDPVAEADVYMAYGRDAQAEEILLEALQKDPQRTAIHAKLLEIYAARRSLKQFETLASELYAQTGGVGTVWEKVAHLGAGLDPNNPLYSASQVSPVASAPVFDADATMVVSLDKARDAVQPNAIEATPVSEAFASLEMPAMESPADETLPPPELGAMKLEAVSDAAEVSDGEMSLDFDLASPTLAAEVVPEPTPIHVAEEFAAAEPSADSSALDFDLGALAPAASPVVEPLAEPPVPDDLSSEAIDFDLTIPADSAEFAELSETAVPDFSPEGTLVTRKGMDLAGGSDLATDLAVDDFSMDLPVPEELLPTELDLGSSVAKVAVAPSAKAVQAAAAAASMDFEPSFDLDQPEAINAAPVVESVDDESLSFEVNLTDSVVMGQPMMPPDFDIGAINLDLSAEPLGGGLPEEFSPPSAEDLMVHEPSPAAPMAAPEPERTEQWEEVNTKLDLAKAYEEMGDLEGARELLLEVVSEGTVDLVEQARTILGRIGE